MNNRKYDWPLYLSLSIMLIITAILSFSPETFIVVQLKWAMFPVAAICAIYIANRSKGKKNLDREK